MKKYIIVLISVVSFAFSSKAQVDENLKNNVDKMYEASYILDYDAILSYTHPKLFELISKEQMVTVMQSMFENEAFQIRFVHPKVNFTYGEIKNIAGINYCIINYNNAIRMSFDKKLTDDEITDVKKNLLAAKEYEKVTYEKDRNSFLIEGKSTIIGVKGETTQNQWRFINYSSSQAEIAKMILSEEILTQLGLNN